MPVKTALGPAEDPWKDFYRFDHPAYWSQISYCPGRRAGKSSFTRKVEDLIKDMATSAEPSTTAVGPETDKDVNPILRYFEYQHLPEHLQPVSEWFYDLAHKIDLLLADGPEKSAGLRKLLESKDCAVRASL